LACQELVPLSRVLCSQMADRGRANDVNAPEIDNGFRRLPVSRVSCVKFVRKLQKCELSAFIVYFVYICFRLFSVRGMTLFMTDLKSHVYLVILVYLFAAVRCGQRMQCAKRYGPDSSHCLYWSGGFLDP
jgi:hypothetical protein